MSSLELTEWMAFERFAGPVGNAYRDELLAGLHELIQNLNHLTGQAHFTDKNHKKGPAPKPEHYPRPQELFKWEETLPEENTDVDDEDGWVMPPSFGDGRGDDE